MRYLVFGGLLLAVQVYLAVHASRRGRTFWIYAIFIFPVVGCVVYALTYVLPEMRSAPSVKETGEKIARTINPTRQLIKLQKELEFSDTVINRQALADEYMKIGDYKNAVKLYESCLEGVYQDDEDMIMDLAKAYHYNGDHEKAKELLLKIKKDNPSFRNMRTLLLLAITYEKLGDTAAALKEYEGIINSFPGEEARCRYALLLKRSGNIALAKNTFERIISDAKSSPRYYHRDQKQWINIAKENLKAIYQLEAAGGAAHPPS